MVALLLTAFMMGGLGSLHCVGMCGPLALSLPVVDSSYISKFNTTLLYNIGRVTTYAFLGILVGGLGASLRLLGFQQGLSVGLGVIIILFLLWPKYRLQAKTQQFSQGLFGRLRVALSTLFHRKNYQSIYFIGILNGLLPCGLVYMALAGAVATASPLKSSLFMMAFGLGTLPLMWALLFFGSFINIQTRVVIRKAYPWLMFGMACLLIIRGLGVEWPILHTIGRIPHESTGDVLNCVSPK